jgi:hypothetical protein
VAADVPALQIGNLFQDDSFDDGVRPLNFGCGVRRIRFLRIRFLQIRFLQIRFLRIRFLQIRFLQIRFSQQSFGEMRSQAEPGNEQVRRRSRQDVDSRRP